MVNKFTFFTAQRQLTDPDEIYEQKIKQYLENYRLCLKSKFVSEMPGIPIKRIIGIAIKPPKYSIQISVILTLLIDCSG
jgi:hypothetical protein